MNPSLRFSATLASFLLLAGCDQGGHAKGPTTGSHPQIAAPGGSLLPVANFSTAMPWPAGEHPSAPAGFTVTRYAEKLDHPRWLYVLPNGDVLVAEATTVEGPVKSLQDVAQKFLERNNGSVGASANRITLLRDSKSSGTVDTRTIFLSHLNQPFGMALIANNFYVGNTDGVWRYPYAPGETAIAGTGKRILDLPAGGYNNHWTRNLYAGADGKTLYVTVGSGSNIGENGAANEFHRADILQINPDGTGLRVFASGTRNPNGLEREPSTGTMWAVVNERDMLGEDLVPDYFTRVRDGDFYGWPYSYWGQHVDSRVTPQRPDLVARALTPDYALGAHVAPLGLAFYTGTAFPARYRGGAFIGEHGSWNRSEYSGYKVVYVPFAKGMPSGQPQDFLTGFLHDPKAGIAYGRPVGLAVDRTGALLVADDTGGIIWRVAAK